MRKMLMIGTIKLLTLEELSLELTEKERERHVVLAFIFEGHETLMIKRYYTHEKDAYDRDNQTAYLGRTES
jgi:hypothetical protein